jgi:hypothetical protein
MTRTTPRRLITLQFSQIGLTELLTFIPVLFQPASRTQTTPMMIPRPGSRLARWARTRCPVRMRIPNLLASSERPAMRGPASVSRRYSCWGNSAITVASKVCGVRDNGLRPLAGGRETCHRAPGVSSDGHRKKARKITVFWPSRRVATSAAGRPLSALHPWRRIRGTGPPCGLCGGLGAVHSRRESPLDGCHRPQPGGGRRGLQRRQ